MRLIGSDGVDLLVDGVMAVHEMERAQGVEKAVAFGGGRLLAFLRTRTISAARPATVPVAARVLAG